MALFEEKWLAAAQARAGVATRTFEEAVVAVCRAKAPTLPATATFQEALHACALVDAPTVPASASLEEAVIAAAGVRAAGAVGRTFDEAMAAYADALTSAL